MPLLNKRDMGFRRGPPGPPEAYLVATLLVAIALALCLALKSTFPALQLSTLLLAVVATVVLRGIAAGCFSLVICAAFAWYFILPPEHSIRPASAAQAAALLLFIVYACAILVLLNFLRTESARSDHAEQTTNRQLSPVVQPPQHSEEEMRVWADAFTHAAVGLTITDPITRSLRFVNKAWAEMHGWTPEEALGMPTSMFFPEEELPRLPSLYAEADRTGHVTFEVRRRRKDGSTFLAAFDVVTVHDTDGKLLYRVASSRDITESRRAEELLRHATKMEAIGALTGGMAHDFNNLLGAIILSLDFVQAEMPDTDHLKRFVVEAKTAAQSGAELIRGLLAFARRQSLNPSRIDVNDQVRGMHRLLCRVLGEEIKIELACAADVWPVTADPSQLEASLMNLATNARDAMPNGGILTITTSNQRLDADYARLNPAVTPGDYAMIAMSDTGTGMTPEVVAHIFEPFFSTKEVGQGTGLGLSMVLGFAMQSGGHVSVYSEPGVGTTIRLFLPRARSGADPLPAGNEADARTPTKGGGEAVLVVEDNTVMRRVVAHQLAQLNYVVTEADSASAALAMLETTSVDLLFTDVVMPGGMDGFELAERVRARWPSIKVLLTSGFSGDRVNRRFGGLPSPPRLLGKPYDLAELARTVREALTT